jgi:cob(I)alamin adenosyltransferase
VKIYTRRGDAGQTDLFGGPRVGKDDLRVEAYGSVDELNAILGQAAAATEQKGLLELSQDIQSRLFDLGSQLATPDPKHREKSGLPGVTLAHVKALEDQVDSLESELEPLTRFILPGGTAAAAAYHVARTVCRRAERRCVTLAREDDVPDAALRYLNRLSDLLFVMARVENHRAGVTDVEWAGLG